MATIEQEFTYVLYFKVFINDTEKVVLLASSDDPIKLYTNALNVETTDDSDIKGYILKWLSLVEDSLDEQERKDMEYAFMHNPETELAYRIKDMELNIELINKF
mgnify:CR=1 FL=1